MENLINLSVANIADGALIEQMNFEVQKVLNNIIDPNTDATKKRKVTVSLTFVPSSDDRNMADIVFETKSTLVPIRAGKTRIAFEKTNDDAIVADELRRGTMTGQIVVNTDGEVIEPKVPNRIVKVK